MHENVKNSRMLVGLFVEGQPYWPQPKVVGHHDKSYEWSPGSNMSFTKHVGDLGTSSYVHWITSGGVGLIHIHQNRWVREPTKATSTYTSLSIQALIYCHLAKTISIEPPDGGTFSNKYAHGCICECCKCCTTRINSQNKPDLGLESPRPIPTCEKPWHNHPKMTKSIGPILAKFSTPNKVMLFSKEHW